MLNPLWLLRVPLFFNFEPVGKNSGSATGCGRGSANTQPVFQCTITHMSHPCLDHLIFNVYVLDNS